MKAGMRRNLLRLQYIHQITKSPHSFFSSQMIQKPYLCMGLSQQPRLFSGGKVVKRKVSSNSTYRSCFAEINKIKLCWEVKRTLNSFLWGRYAHTEGKVSAAFQFLSHGCWGFLCSNCFQKKGLPGNSGIPLSRWLP